MCKCKGCNKIIEYCIDCQYDIDMKDCPPSKTLLSLLEKYKDSKEFNEEEFNAFPLKGVN